jgi:hypothetical protein
MTEQERADIENRAKTIRDIVKRTWDPPLTTGRESKGDVAQSAAMITLAWIMGVEFMGDDLTNNQKETLRCGIEGFKQALKLIGRTDARPWN